eukprot:TRINITY_DN4650_c0_g1_i1.p1 TRINITY_DN4650_c0_g1~~TRINITY_DN4650_c0_g1_i1.p1  ORF type:complete len:279 (+),score=61.88 TRINITY_DN4650_c0_g1_i1:28-837(+)
MKSALLFIGLICFAFSQDCVPRKDHNDDHDGYYETIRVHTIKPNVTVTQATQAIDRYFTEVIKTDDAIALFGYYDVPKNTYVTCGTWRTKEGAASSFDRASKAAPYTEQLQQTSFIGGPVSSFIEYLDNHTNTQLGFWKTTRISVVNGTSVGVNEKIENDLLPLLGLTTPNFDGLKEYISVQTSEPNNQTIFGGSTWTNSTFASKGVQFLSQWYANNTGSNLVVTSFFSGNVLNFWHSEPTQCPVTTMDTSIGSSLLVSSLYLLFLSFF